MVEGRAGAPRSGTPRQRRWSARRTHCCHRVRHHRDRQRRELSALLSALRVYLPDRLRGTIRLLGRALVREPPRWRFEVYATERRYFRGSGRATRKVEPGIAPDE